ncbi:MAG: calcium-binding protein [Cognatishimia sp.]|nr:calcium-binding protein [Cognatishimia sp.]
MRKLLRRVWLSFILVALAAGFARAESKKLFFFGNSLIHHLTDTDTTTVPHWLAHFAEQSGREFELDGHFGFLKEFPAKLPPEPQWKFADVKSAWGENQTFDGIGYDTIVFNPTNFVQHRGPSIPYRWDNPDNWSPVTAALDLLDRTADGKRVVIYEGWADMEPYGYPPSRRKLRKYHEYNIGEYHEWYLEFAERIQRERPELQVELIPVARVLSRALRETGLSKIGTLDIYADDMTHGSATLYYLAAAVTYAGLFNEMPTFGGLPPEIDPMVEPYFNALKGIIAEEMNIANTQAQAVMKRVKAPVAIDAAKVMPVAATDAPSLGIGLNAISDWSTQLPFLDLMKSARPWVGHRRGQWGGFEVDELEADGILDANGWPKEFPFRMDGVETFILTDMPEELTELGGLYRLTYEGQGRIDFTGLARPVRYNDGEIWFRYAPGEGSVGIKITETDPDKTGDYIRNIAVVHENHIPLYDMGVTFNPKWLKLIQDMRLVRFMDWMETNETEISSWSERPMVSDYTYMRRGAPAEVMIELVNQIGTDAWFNMPHTADESYIEGFATLVRDQMRPSLKAYVEYSNELWNFIFPQTQWAVDEAKAKWGSRAPDNAWFQLAGLNAAKVMQGWSRVFAGQEDRIVRVAAVHTGWVGLEEPFLEAHLDPMRPADHFDAYAITGYFGHELGDEEGPAQVRSWLKQGEQVAIENSVAEIRKTSVDFLTNEAWPHHARVSQSYGLDLIMYEGGTHVVGHGDWVNDKKLTAFFEVLNYSPEMGALYQEVIAEWTKAGGKLFNAFVDVAPTSKWGSWGALRSLNDNNARFEALLAYNTSGVGQPDGRAREVFANGVQLSAAPEGEMLDGSVYADILLGGAGDDTLISHGGSDIVDGGEGVDHVELQGFMEEYRFFRDGQTLRAESQYGTVQISAVETMSFSKMPGVNVGFADFF